MEKSLPPSFAPASLRRSLGCIILTKSVHASLQGMNAIVIGRSNLVGRPLVQLLLNENATVTIAHSRSRDLARLCARADLVYAAVGKPEMVRGDWIKPGASVIDVGINRLQDKDGKTRLVGDVAFAEVSAVAGAITPVPGGVGQMTVACLLVNTLRAACAIHGLAKPGVELLSLRGASETSEPGTSRFRVWSFGPSRNDDCVVTSPSPARCLPGSAGAHRWRRPSA